MDQTFLFTFRFWFCFMIFVARVMCDQSKKYTFHFEHL